MMYLVKVGSSFTEDNVCYSWNGAPAVLQASILETTQLCLEIASTIKGTQLSHDLLTRGIFLLLKLTTDIGSVHRN